jgi:phosphodiesterase/alkaline phosphatase D-like protein
MMPPQDAWDGYRANRNRILDQLYGKNIDNTIILAGDSHANWVSDLSRKDYFLDSGNMHLNDESQTSMIPKRELLSFDR